jgi:hypothetical protein
VKQYWDKPDGAGNGQDDGRIHPPRIVINLHRLPVTVQYLIALVVVAGVLMLVWHTRTQHPTPVWITQYLLPTIQWGGGAMLICLLAYRALLWLRRRHNNG